MKIALLISGRSARYEVCLLETLKNTSYDVDVFMSINDEECKYYEIMRKKLSKWLKGLYINPYNVPDDFENFSPNTLNQKIGERIVPLNVLSMYYNDYNAFNMALKYADDNYFEYDCYMKFRSDIISYDFPPVIKNDEYKIFSVVPLVQITSPLVDIVRKNFKGNTLWVSDAIVYGNRKSMKSYCDTYNFTMEMNREFDNNYPIHFETCITQNVYDKKLSVEFFNHFYRLDRNRRIFDKTWEKSGTEECGDLRIHQIEGALPPIDIKKYETTSHIPVSEVI